MLLLMGVVVDAELDHTVRLMLYVVGFFEVAIVANFEVSRIPAVE